MWHVNITILHNTYIPLIVLRFKMEDEKKKKKEEAARKKQEQEVIRAITETPETLHNLVTVM